jgi:hypothetical protein
VEPLELPDACAVARGWEQQLDRAMRVELPEPVQTVADRARADVLLTPASSAVVAALEDWGFDEEAADAWHRLGIRARRAARRRRTIAAAWSVASTGHDDPARTLLALRQVLVRDDAKTVELLPLFPPDWLGQNLAVHDAPLRRGGQVSFAVRWHGARPALLWDAPAGISLRASALDPAFVGSSPAGDTLLAEPPSTLLRLGVPAPAPTEGVAEPDAPESFS